MAIEAVFSLNKRSDAGLLLNREYLYQFQHTCMKQGDDLFLLIKSLSVSEKRYFKIFAQRHVIGDKNRYEYLFDLIDKQTISNAYDEELIKKQLSAKESKNIAAGKHYLYELILRSMRNFHESKSIADQINNRISDIKFLLDKGLHAKCRQLILSTKKDAFSIEHHAAIIELSYLERRLERLKIDKESSALFSTISAMENEAAKHIADEIFFRKLYDENFILLQEEYTPANSSRIEHIHDEVIKYKERASSFNAKALFFIIQADDAQLAGKYSEARKFMRKCVALFEENEVIKNEQSQRYINLLSNYLNSCFLANEFDDFQSTIEKLKLLQPRKEEEEILLFRSRYLLELLYYINMQNWDEAEKLIPDIITGLTKYKNRLPAVSVIVLYYNMAIALFSVKKYEKSLAYFNYIIDVTAKNIRKDIQQNAKLFQIVIHYELENFNLVQTLIYNFKRSLKKSDRLNEFEKVVLDLFKKLTDTPDKSSKLKLFSVAKDALSPIAVSQQGAHEIISWIDTKMIRK